MMLTFKFIKESHLFVRVNCIFNIFFFL